MKVRARILSTLLGISLIFGSVNPVALAAEQPIVDEVEVSSETVETTEISLETGTVSDAEAEPEAATDTGSELGEVADAESKSETDVDKKSETETDSKDNTELDSETETENTGKAPEAEDTKVDSKIKDGEADSEIEDEEAVSETENAEEDGISVQDPETGETANVEEIEREETRTEYDSVSGNTTSSGNTKFVQMEMKGVYQFGDAPSGEKQDDIATYSDKNPVQSDKAKEYLYQELLDTYEAGKEKAEITISDYKITVNEISDLVNGLINDRPDLYFVNRKYGYSYNNEDVVTSLNFTYDTSFSLTDFKRGRKEALSVVEPSMTDLEKAIVLHDYLAVNCEYDYDRLNNGTMPDTSYSAYGVLVNRTAVCQGYALAYKYLLDQVGIKCYMVNSDPMNHAWNLIVLDDKYYQVDVTWADPVRDLVGRAAHTYMFLSDDAFRTAGVEEGKEEEEGKKQGHYDWAVTSGSDKVNYKATDTRYDHAFWADSNAPLVISGDSCYYVSFKDKKIKKGNVEKPDETGEDICDIGAWTGYQGAFSGLFQVNGRLYYNNQSSICSIELDGSDPRTVFTPNATSGYIYGSAWCQGKVKYILNTSPNLTGKEEVSAADINFGIGDTETCVVTYNMRGYGKQIAPSFVGKDELLKKPSDPTAAGYKFEGWYKERECINAWNFDEDKVTGDITLYAKWVYTPWTLTDGVLTIFGSGDMEDYPKPEEVPWYSQRESITSVIIDDEITSIGSYAFYMCKNLSKIDLSSIEDTIGEKAFYMCDNLSEIGSINAGVIGDEAFYMCSNLSGITYFDAYFIGKKAFYMCTNLSGTVRFDADNIDEEAFCGCSGLTKIIIRNFGGTIGKRAFGECSSLTEIEMQDGSTVIGEEVFYACSSLTDITIPRSVTTIGRGAFGKCDNLKEKNVYYVGSQTQWEAIAIGEDNDWLESAIFHRLYTVTFDLLGHGYKMPSLTLGKENILLRQDIEDPYESGYKFEGWCKEKECTTKWDFENEKIVTEDITLYAKWAPADESAVTYTVKYDLQGHGSQIAPVTVIAGGRLFRPSWPSEEGYLFEGWYKEKECINEWEFEKEAVNKDITLYANWLLDGEATVTFDLQEHGSPIASKTVTAGELLEKPSDPTAKGYIFDGWYKEKECTNKWDFAKEIVKDNIILYAKWILEVTVTYDIQGKGSSIASVTVAAGTLLTKPSDPTAEGYKFDGWYKEKECTNAWDFAKDEVTEDTTLYAKWVVTYTVTYDMQGQGSQIAPVTVNAGDKLTKPSDPAAEGYMFDGWYKEKECTSAWDFAKDEVTENITLYAKWVKNEEAVVTYTVTYDMQGQGSQIAPVTVNAGDKLAKPADPTAEEYQFEGWYKEKECNTAWNFEKDVVTENITLYAKWIYTGSIVPGDLPDKETPKGLWIAGIKDYTYNGTAIKPAVRVYFEKERLQEGLDYTISYKNNTKAAGRDGQKAPAVTIKGKGSYAGTVTETFTIKQALLTDSNLKAASVYQQGKKYAPVLILDGVILKAKTDYTLTYKDGSGTVLSKQPVALGSYTMHIEGKGNCTGIIDFSYEIAEKGCMGIEKGKATVGQMVYGGQYPSTTLSVDGKTLTAGDYAVVFSNTNAKGTATAAFIGIGNYTGVLKKTFKVTAQPLQNANITVAKSVDYEKGGARPAVSVTVNGTELLEGVDYTVSYKGNTKLGSFAQVTVKGKGNYSGSKSAAFQIAGKALNADGMKILVPDVVTGKKPAVTIYDTNGKKLSSGSDYKAEIDKTAHTVTITGGKNGCYTGTVVKNYEELAADKIITSVKLNKSSLPKDYNVYTGKEITLKNEWLTVKTKNTVLSSDCYTLSYVNNVKKGTATVIVQGMNGYGGIKMMTFSIKGYSLGSVLEWFVPKSTANSVQEPAPTYF